VSKPIILDCDPGHDDAMAILLARGCPEIDLLAITTVAGNQTLEKTTLNARRVCTAARIDDVPIYAGCDRPLLRPQIIAPGVHGESGLDGPSFGEPTVPVADEHAVDFLVRTLMASDGDITLVPVGPLTNIAMALRREPGSPGGCAAWCSWAAPTAAGTGRPPPSSTSWPTRRPRRSSSRPAGR
jgi:purine nucleosidase